MTPGILVALMALFWLGLLLIAEVFPRTRAMLAELAEESSRAGFLSALLAWLSVLLLLLLAAGWGLAPVTQGSEFGVHFVALKMLEGFPAYPSGDDNQQYALLYGPLTYLVYLAAYAALGLEAATPKVIAIPMVLAGLAATWAIVATAATTRERRLGVALAVLAGLLWIREHAIAPKADPFIYLLAAVGTLAAARRWPLWAIGACAGLAFGFKATAILAFIPIWAIRARDGAEWREHATGATAAVLCATAPFVHPLVGLPEYWELLEAGVRHGFGIALFLNCFFTIAAAVVIAMVWTMPARRARLWLALLVASLLASAPASKDFAGYYHLAPFIPAYAWLLASEHAAIRPDAQRRTRTIWFAAGVLFLLLPIHVGIYVFGQSLEAREARMAAAEVANARVRFRAVPIGVDPWTGAIERDVLIGYGPLPFLSFWATLDDALASKPTPAGVIDNIQRCTIPVWIVAHGATPFAHQFQSAHGPVVVPGHQMATAFAASYKLVRSYDRIDIWQCRSTMRP